MLAYCNFFVLSKYIVILYVTIAFKTKCTISENKFDYYYYKDI